MGGRAPSSTRYMPTPTAPIIYQTVQSPEAWQAAKDYYKDLESQRTALIAEQEGILGTAADQAKRQEGYKKQSDYWKSIANTTQDPNWWSKEQEDRSKVSKADREWDIKNQMKVDEAKKKLLAKAEKTSAADSNYNLPQNPSSFKG